jgi:group II intron reverse transcriptase/maturase
MTGATTSGNMSPGLLKVAERAKRDPSGRILSLARLIDIATLRRAYDRQRKDAAVGVDGVTKEQYGQDLEARLADLHARLVSKRYRHQPIRRVHIPKDNGKTRPIGISAFEDKLVQDAVREVLEAIYEQDFFPCSYGFRRGRSAHDAVRALDGAVAKGRATWILETDIVSFFDSVDRNALMEMLRGRIADESLMQLIGKCLHVGVLDGADYSEPDVGTIQGSVLSPLLGNVYLHYALDVWFEREVKPRLWGRAILIRYADDLVITFERQDDAERVMAVLGKRMERYGLTLHPDKTRLVPFGRPSSTAPGRKGPATFDFLGFTFFWGKSRWNKWWMQCKTMRARLRRTIVSVAEWCRRHRHDSVAVQHAALTRRLRGHFNYFGVSGNGRSLRMVLHQAKRAWFKWLQRRSQRRHLTWEKFSAMYARYPLPAPRIRVRIWAT